jgi:hypothetical protein
MKKDAINKLRGMHSHHVGVYFKLYYLCKDNQVAEIMSDNIALHIASMFINPGISMREAKIQQEALALDVAFTSLEKANLVKYEVDQIVVNELYKEPRNKDLVGKLEGCWDEWIEYKTKVSKTSYKSAKSEYMAYSTLMRDCNNDHDLAKQVIVNAIGRQWVGFNVDVYLEQQSKLKNQSNDTSKIGRISRQDLQQWIDKE